MYTKQTCHRILNNRVVNVYLSYVNCTENIAYAKPTQTPNETKIDIYNCILHICNALHGAEFTATMIVKEMEIITQLYCKMIIFAHCSN